MTFNRESTIHALCKALDELFIEITTNTGYKNKENKEELIKMFVSIADMLPENGIRGAYTETLSLQNKVSQIKKAIRRNIFNWKGETNND